MPQFILIIGEDPDLIEFSAPGVPPNMDAHKVMEGLNGPRDRLKGLGHEARILLTRALLRSTPREGKKEGLVVFFG
jgi:hypothetical protein